MPEQQKALSDAIATDKMNKIIECIIKGKYSSACLILLEATGYNPLHYIPYSTYHRLQKQYLQSSRKHTNFQNNTGSLTAKSLASKNLAPENMASNGLSSGKPMPVAAHVAESPRAQASVSRITMGDLDYVEPLSADALSASGGIGYKSAIASSWQKQKNQMLQKIEQTLKMETFEKETSLYFKYQLRG